MSYDSNTGLLIGNRSYIGNISCDAHTIAVSPPVTEKSHLPTLAIVASSQMGNSSTFGTKIAPEIVVNSFMEVLGQAIPTDPRMFFTQAIETAADRLSAYHETYATIGSLLTSCAAVIVIDDKLYTVNIGNCRIYLLRDKRLRQISTDHTFIQRLIERGHIVYKDPRVDMPVDGNPFTRHLGVERQYRNFGQPDFRLRLADTESDSQAESNQGLPLREGDEILLCTDGMIGSPRYFPDVEDEQIQEALLNHDHPQQAVEALIDLARKQMEYYTRDITAILLKFVNS
ncbi:MAG TPA: hypothetical protein VFR47_14385 [Anaerolineales bacterium]|nr:hypothetical protein [Anaerolineales bacterium]